MTDPWKRLLAILFLGMLCSVSTPADELHLDNGDRISGTVVRMTGGKLRFETEYAGSITVDWTAVDSLIMDSPGSFVLAGEPTGRLRGSVISSGEGVLRIRAEGLRQEVSVGLGDIVHRDVSQADAIAQPLRHLEDRAAGHSR